LEPSRAPLPCLFPPLLTPSPSNPASSPTTPYVTASSFLCSCPTTSFFRLRKATTCASEDVGFASSARAGGMAERPMIDGSARTGGRRVVVGGRAIESGAQWLREMSRTGEYCGETSAFEGFDAPAGLGGETGKVRDAEYWQSRGRGRITAAMGRCNGAAGCRGARGLIAARRRSRDPS
jgi:hypothetical protein